MLKIPWTNLYAAPSHVCIKGLYLLAVPNDAVVYDEKKEQQASREAKKRLLERIEMIKMQEAASMAGLLLFMKQINSFCFFKLKKMS